MHACAFPSSCLALVRAGGWVTLAPLLAAAAGAVGAVQAAAAARSGCGRRGSRAGGSCGRGASGQSSGGGGARGAAMPWPGPWPGCARGLPSSFRALRAGRGEGGRRQGCVRHRRSRGAGRCKSISPTVQWGKGDPALFASSSRAGHVNSAIHCISQHVRRMWFQAPIVRHATLHAEQRASLPPYHARHGITPQAAASAGGDQEAAAREAQDAADPGWSAPPLTEQQLLWLEVGRATPSARSPGPQLPGAHA